MSPPSDSPNIDDFFKCLKKVLLQTWKETGFGHLEIDTERVNNSSDKIRVIIRNSPSYRFVFSNEEVERWQISKLSHS